MGQGVPQPTSTMRGEAYENLTFRVVSAEKTVSRSDNLRGRFPGSLGHVGRVAQHSAGFGKKCQIKSQNL